MPEPACFPVCASCKTNGCTKVWAPPEETLAERAAKHGLVSSDSARTRALKHAVIERDLARYWEMPCGHWTTVEEQEFYCVWKPKGKAWWCSECQAWQERPPQRRESGSDDSTDPLF